MNTIGFFRRDGEGFAGRLVTPSLDVALTLAPAAKFSAKAPDYVALIGAAECGVAWRSADGTGAILNVKLDDPAWPEPVSARLMAAEGGDLPLTWMRRAEAAQAAPAASQGGSPGANSGLGPAGAPAAQPPP